MNSSQELKLQDLQEMIDNGIIEDFETDSPIYEKTIKSKKHRNPESTKEEGSYYKGNYA